MKQIQAAKENEVRIRLSRVHYLNGVKKMPGMVIRVPESTSTWLIGRKVATLTK